MDRDRAGSINLTSCIIFTPADTHIQSLRELSKSTRAKVYLVDADGEVLISFISGKAGSDANTEVQYIIRDLLKVLTGATSERTHSTAQYNTSLVVGVPTTYLGSPAALFVHQSLAAMETLQRLNRNQLVKLSIVRRRAGRNSDHARPLGQHRRAGRGGGSQPGRCGLHPRAGLPVPEGSRAERVPAQRV